MNNQNNFIDIDLLTMPSERILGVHKEGDTCDEDEEDCFIFDPGPVSLEYAISCIAHEKEIFDRLYVAGKDTFDKVLFVIRDELYEEIDGWATYNFGLGGLALGLASIGCIPVDGDAAEIEADTFPYLNPWIQFHIPAEKVPLLLMAAQSTDIAVKNGDGGSVGAYGEDVRKFNLMAEYLCNLYKGRELKIA